MITLIHGDDLAASRIYYKTVQQKNSLLFDGEKVSKDTLEQSFQSDGLFDEKKYIAIENFFSKRKASKEMDEVSTLIRNNENNADIIIWESKLLTKKAVTTFPSATIKTFSLPKSLFAFLDAIQPNNTKKLLSLYHKTLQETEAEMIFYMITRHIRMLLALADESSSEQIDEIKRLAPWQKSKLLSVSRQFSVKQLQSLHARIFDIDVKSKTGGLPIPLSHTIDFLLLSI